MKSTAWFRATAGLFGFFALSHTLGFLKPPAAASPAAPVYASMQAVSFPAMGFTRSYLDFYRGFGLSVSVEFVILALLAWQLASLAERHPREATPLASTLLVGALGTTIVSFVYFFAAPMAVSAVTLGCVLTAVRLLALEARDHRVRAGSDGFSAGSRYAAT